MYSLMSVAQACPISVVMSRSASTVITVSNPTNQHPPTHPGRSPIISRQCSPNLPRIFDFTDPHHGLGSRCEHRASLDLLRSNHRKIKKIEALVAELTVAKHSSAPELSSLSSPERRREIEEKSKRILQKTIRNQNIAKSNESDNNDIVKELVQQIKATKEQNTYASCKMEKMEIKNIASITTTYNDHRVFPLNTHGQIDCKNGKKQQALDCNDDGYHVDVGLPNISSIDEELPCHNSSRVTENIHLASINKRIQNFVPNHNSNKKRYDSSNNDERHVSEIQKVVEQHLECIDHTKKTTCPIENHHLLEPTERVKKFNKEQQAIESISRNIQRITERS